LTTAKFYSPSGQQISHQGIEPDFVVAGDGRHYVARPSNEGEVVSQNTDAALQAALDIARQSTRYQVRQAQ
jgi:carboxyl-terminal processing protease